MKPKYHISPISGFLNDPNGLAQFHGIYHVFYQWLPDVVPQGSKRWRHCVSDDLIHWTDEGSVLEPDEWYEKNGCYSGSGIVAGDKYYLFYTGNVRDAEGGRETYQCTAVSEDGKTFVKKGPVVYLPDTYTPHFRDPKVWRKEGRWWMLVGAQEKGKKGNVALFVSDDLQKWDWIGSMLNPVLDWGYMCECPDLLEVQGPEFLIVSRQKEDGCRGMSFAGKMDYHNGKFTVTDNVGKLLDEGFDFYAPQSFIDESGRCLLMGWLGSGEIDYQMSQPAVKEGWLHSLTIPREVFARDGTLCQRPAKELASLRQNGQSTVCDGNTMINRGTASMEILAEDLNGETLSLDFGTAVSICWDNRQHILSVRRAKWDAPGYDEKHLPLAGLEKLQIFLDQSTTEIFINDGEKVLTMKAYFSENVEIKVFSESKITVNTWVLEVS